MSDHPIMERVLRLGRWALCMGLRLAVALGVVWTAGAVAIAVYGDVGDVPEGDAAVVLGAAAYPRGPSPVFKARLDYAADLYHGGQVPHIIVTGGYGPGADVSEGETGFNYLRTRDVPPEAITFERCSVNTRQNLAEAAHIARKRGWASLIVVSDPLHLARAVYIAEQLGLSASPAPTPHTRFKTFKTQLPFAYQEARLYARQWLAIQTDLSDPAQWRCPRQLD